PSMLLCPGTGWGRACHSAAPPGRALPPGSRPHRPKRRRNSPLTDASEMARSFPAVAAAEVVRLRLPLGRPVAIGDHLGSLPLDAAEPVCAETGVARRHFA